VKYYQGRVVWSIIWIVLGLLWLFQGILQFQKGYYGFALAYVFIALLALYNAYIYRRTYLGLGDGKIILNSSFIIRIVIILANITSLEQTGKKLRLTYNEGSRSMKQKIKLSMLEDLDREEFLRDLNSALSKTKSLPISSVFSEHPEIK